VSSESSVFGAIAAPIPQQTGGVRASIRLLMNRAAMLSSRQLGFFSLCDQALVSVTNFATALLIGRVCGKAELGVYTLAWTLLTMASELSGALITRPYTVFGPQLNRFRRTRYLGSMLVHQLVFSVLFAAAMTAGAFVGSWRGWLAPGLFNAVMATAAVIVFVGLRDFVRRVSFAELRIGSALLVDVTACVAQAAGMWLLFRVGQLTSSKTFILLGISSAIAAGVWLRIRSKSFRLSPPLYVPDLRRNWLFSRWVLASGVLSAFARYLYPWMLAAFHGTAVTGSWAACSAIVAVSNPIVLGLSNYVLPQISNVYATSGAEAMRRSVHRASLFFAALLLPVVIILTLSGDRIVMGVYGKSYSGNAVVLFLLALNMLISSATNTYSQGLFSLNSAKIDTLVNVVCVVLLFTIGIVPIRSYAAVGAAAALLFSSVITSLILIVAFSWRVRQEGRNLMSTQSFPSIESTSIGRASDSAGETTQPRVLVIGPGRRGRGGIDAVIWAYTQSAIWESHECAWLETYDDRGRAAKVLIAAKALFSAPLAIWRSDIVHIHSAFRMSIVRKSAFLALAKLLRKKVILHIHDFDTEYLDKAGVNSFAAKVLRAADCVVALSPLWARVLRRSGAKNVVVVPNPVMLSEQSKEASNHNSCDILYVGKLESRKGYDDLIRAMQIVVQRVPTARLRLAGHGELANAIALAEQLGISKSVECLGWIQKEDRERTYCSADVFCLPSHNEGVAMAVLEAMACGLPVVCTPVGGLPDVINTGKNGILVQPGNVDEIAAALISLLENPNLRNAVGKAAYKTVEDSCSLPAVAGQLGQLYRSLMAPTFSEAR